MRYVELRRHTDNEGDDLTAEGRRQAEEIGASHLHPPYDAFVSTGARRATQMAEILRDASGQSDLSVLEQTALRSSVEDRWRQAAKQAGKGADVDAMRAQDAELVDHESRLLGAALREVVESLPPGGRALVIGHSPTNEAAVLGLTGRVVRPMAKGAGVLVLEDDGAYDVADLP